MQLSSRPPNFARSFILRPRKGNFSQPAPALPLQRAARGQDPGAPQGLFWRRLRPPRPQLCKQSKLRPGRGQRPRLPSAASRSRQRFSRLRPRRGPRLREPSRGRLLGRNKTRRARGPGGRARARGGGGGARGAPDPRVPPAPSAQQAAPPAPQSRLGGASSTYPAHWGCRADIAAFCGGVGWSFFACCRGSFSRSPPPASLPPPPASRSSARGAGIPPLLHHLPPGSPALSLAAGADAGPGEASSPCPGCTGEAPALCSGSAPPAVPAGLEKPWGGVFRDPPQGWRRERYFQVPLAWSVTGTFFFLPPSSPQPLAPFLLPLQKGWKFPGCRALEPRCSLPARQ